MVNYLFITTISFLTGVIVTVYIMLLVDKFISEMQLISSQVKKSS